MECGVEYGDLWQVGQLLRADCDTEQVGRVVQWRQGIAFGDFVDRFLRNQHGVAEIVAAVYGSMTDCGQFFEQAVGSQDLNQFGQRFGVRGIAEFVHFFFFADFDGDFCVVTTQFFGQTADQHDLFERFHDRKFDR